MKKGLEQVKPPRDIHEWEAGEPHEEKKAMRLPFAKKEDDVSKGTISSAAVTMVDNMIKACGPVAKADDKKKPADKPPGEMMTASPAKQVKNPLSVPGSGSHFKFGMDKSADSVKKDFEHMAGEYKKIAPASPASVSGTAKEMGWSKPALAEGAGAKKQALASASGAPSPATKQALSSIGVGSGEKVTGGATGAVKDAPSGVFTSAPSQPKMAPTAPSLKPGQVISMQSMAKNPQRKLASMTKSAIEILKGMIKVSGGNPANLNGPVHGSTHGGSGPAQQHVKGRESSANESQENGPVHEAAHGGRPGGENGPVHGTPHGGRGPAQQSVRGADGPANDSQMSKASGALEGMMHKPTGTPMTGKHAAGYETAISDHKRGKMFTPQKGDHPDWAAGYKQAMEHVKQGKVSKAVGAMSVPRMPRAMAMALDTWRSATNVLTRGNSRFAGHAGTKPIDAELMEQVEAQTAAGARGPVLKSCGACGRTYTLHKGMEDSGCPSCNQLVNSNMAKSRGGYLVNSFIED